MTRSKRSGVRWFLWASLLPAVIPLQAGLNPETGSAVFQYYTPDQYGANPQNWAIAQDPRGVMYIGNSDGVLEFDGQSWRSIHLKNGSFARSLAIGPRGNVYVGGVGDFGFLQPDSTGQSKFVSLLDKVPAADRRFSDVWRILSTPQGIYFSAYERLFRLNPDESIKIWKPASNFGRAVYVLNGLYVKTREQGLLRMQGDRLTSIAGGAPFTKIGVTDAVSFDDGALIASPVGLFRLDANGDVKSFPTGADSWFAKNSLYTIRVLPDGEIAAGTRYGGLALLSHQGALDRFISTANGLPDNYVGYIFADRQGGVWLATQRGLARFNSGLSRYDASIGLEGDVNSLARYGGSIYAGSTTGLFRMVSAPGLPPRFERIAGINATVEALLPGPDRLLAATEVGIFSVSGDRASVVFQSSRPQPAYDVSASLRDPSIIYSAGKEGVLMLRRAGNTWSRAGAFAPPAEEFRSVLEDADGKVWATTRNAIWRIDFSQQPAQAEKFAAAQGVPAGWINARRLQGHVTFATSKGLLRLSDDGRSFRPDPSLGGQFAGVHSPDVFNIFEDLAGNVWVTGAKYHGIMLKQSSGYKWYPMPLQAAGIKEIYGMSLDSDGTAWATGDKRVLYRWDRNLAGDPDKDLSVLTRLIQIADRDTLYGGSGMFQSRRLPWSDNNLHFEFAAPFYEDPAAVEYQSQLDGSDRGWSPWTRQTRRDYTHLPEGGYQFRVRARTPHGVVIEQNSESSLSFSVAPPWYRTWWAYSVYAVLVALGVWGIVRWRTGHLEKEKEHLENIVEERTVEIRHQRDEIHEQERKSQSLLLNILPAKVADELKANGAVRPVGFDDVTVCFTDFVGFTLSSEKMPPGELVDALNWYFTAFDEIVARHGLEKLKTIGDSYMFAAGLPEPRASHAVDAVLAALEMAEVVKGLATTLGTGWDIRIGLNSGPVVAGVVGIRKFAFDIWGDTVNFASRMESSGAPGRVNISERTCTLLRGLIDCESRGQVRVKEGRYVPMYLARGPVPGFAALYKAAFGVEPRTLPAGDRLTATAGD
ncbi:MAG TPA: adenylate/guanylate cyclase domain-containing protein [Bryobacteraceae bacterium]|jgi:class 3 adenylate cyclase/ligand-binding sensor domain-containing protein|nr:adenylate/guanylate cyclase domain-containing protein [Bryobacteraceae bacterium]